MGMPPRTGRRELSPRVFQILLREAEPHLLLGRDSGGHLELPCVLQKGKLRPLRRESVPIWRPNQGPQVPHLEPFPLQRQTQMPLNSTVPHPPPPSPVPSPAGLLFCRSESPLCLFLWTY